MDDEMLSLTSQTLCRNPDIYTLWNIRREIFLNLKKEKYAYILLYNLYLTIFVLIEYFHDNNNLIAFNRNDEEMCGLVDNEVRLTENCLQVNPKSYCAWHHRGWVLDLHPTPNWKRELALCTKFLCMDERNCKPRKNRTISFPVNF